MMAEEENRIRALLGKLTINAVLRLETGLHIGGASDFAPIGAVDSPFIRDPYTKQPIIPGSSIKGKIRTLLARSLSDAEWLNDINKDSNEIKRLFGSIGENKPLASRLQFSDIYLTKESAVNLSSMDLDTFMGEIKFENSINRIAATATPRQIERVPAGAEFTFFVTYNVEELEEVKGDIQLLADGLKLLQMDYLGGHGSRGYGRVSFRDFKVNFFSLNAENNEKFKNIKDEAQKILQKILKGCCPV